MFDSLLNQFGMTRTLNQFQDMTDAPPSHIHLPVCLWIMDPHSIAAKKNKSHGNEVLLQDTTHLIPRPCYQRGKPCQDPAGNQTTQRSPDHHKEKKTEVVWSCLPFIRSGQNHLTRHSERKKKTRQKEKKKKMWGNNKSASGQAWSLPSPRGQWRTKKKKKWRKLVVTSSVVPNQPSQLGDKWRWWWWSYLQSLASLLHPYLHHLFDLVRIFQWHGGCDDSVDLLQQTRNNNHTMIPITMSETGLITTWTFIQYSSSFMKEQYSKHLLTFAKKRGGNFIYWRVPVCSFPILIGM